MVAGLLGIAGAAGCLVVKIDTSDSLTDISLSDVLTDGFTQTSLLTDTLPTGLAIAATPNVGGTCTGGTVTAVAGSGTITVATSAVAGP